MIENQNTTRKVASHFALWIVTDIQIHQVKIPQIPLGVPPSFKEFTCIN